MDPPLPLIRRNPLKPTTCRFFSTFFLVSFLPCCTGFRRNPVAWRRAPTGRSKPKKKWRKKKRPQIRRPGTTVPRFLFLVLCCVCLFFGVPSKYCRPQRRATRWQEGAERLEWVAFIRADQSIGSQGIIFPFIAQWLQPIKALRHWNGSANQEKRAKVVAFFPLIPVEEWFLYDNRSTRSIVNIVAKGVISEDKILPSCP